MTDQSGGDRHLLRHALATIAYRGGKALRDAPEGFGALVVSQSTRTPVRILAHVGDLFDWALALSDGSHRWRDTDADDWLGQVARFHAGLEALDRRWAAPEPLGVPMEQLLQGPIADALTHVGQLTMLRRLAGAPVRGENYFKADVQVGRVGPDQAAPGFEFD